MSCLHPDPENDLVPPTPSHTHNRALLICVRCLNWIGRIRADWLCFAPDKHHPYQNVTQVITRIALRRKEEEGE